MECSVLILLKHSKSQFLDCTKLKIADYLISPDFTTREKQLSKPNATQLNSKQL